MLYLYFVIGTITSIYLFTKMCFKKQKKEAPKDIIYLVDQNIDHLFSVMDIISPKADAFDKPFQLCQQISQVPDDTHIKIIIQTHGGSLTNCEKILKKLLKHPGGYTAYIKNECFSSGTIIALGAKEIIMTDDSYLGKIDPQIVKNSIGEIYPAIAYSSLNEKYITGENIKDYKISQQVLNYTESLLDIIFKDNKTLKNLIRDEMVYSNFPHSKTFDFETCKKMGLNVRNPTSDESMLFT